MKRYVCLFLLLIATGAFAQSNSPEEAAVLSVQRQWLEASQKGDGETLAQIIDDSFVGNTPGNQMVDKQSLFPPGGSRPMFANTRFVGLKAKVIGSTAVVFGGMITSGESTTLRCAMVYANRGGRWKLIAAQFVPVSETKDGGAQ